MKNVGTDFGRRAAAMAALAAFGCSSQAPSSPSGAAGFTILQANGGASGAANGVGGASPIGSSGGAPGAGAPGTGATPGAGGIPVSSGGATSTGGMNGTGGAGGGAVGSGGAGGAAGAAGMSGAGGMSGTGGDMGGKPPCLTDPNQIVMIGDSYVNWTTHSFPTDMNAVSMLMIDDFAVGGTSMGSGGIGLIPPQFDTALMKHPKIIAVIADGGGNDILVSDAAKWGADGAQCKNNGAQSSMVPVCQQIVQTALDAGHKLFIHMADSGVRDVVFFFYPHVPLGTWLAQDPNGMLDYALPKIKAECDNAYQTSLKESPGKPIRCHFVDLVPVFDGHMEYFAPNDLHPNPTGSKAMAAAVWAKMKQDCVAQPASSGCCATE